MFLIALCLPCSMLLHLQLADIGWFYRYEAYLVGASMPVLAGLYFGTTRIPQLRLLSTRRLFPRAALLACSVLLILPIHQRAKESREQIVRASHHIYSQQYQMGQFLSTMYESGVRVAVNDLGAVTYYADVDILDLWGIGTIDVVRAKRGGTYDSHAIERLLRSRGTEVVMVYTHWFGDLLPSDLIPVGSWTTTTSYWGKTVMFFGTSATSAQLLRDSLRRYRPRLPGSVQVSNDGITEQGL